MMTAPAVMTVSVVIQVVFTTGNDEQNYSQERKQ
jgi:hypothetical protein